MKRRLWILAAAVTLAAAGGVTSAAVAAGAESAARRAPDEAALASGGYVLADHNGQVALYEGEELLWEAEIPVSGLRKADRELIAQGIPAQTYEQALRLLEDLGA